MLWLGLLAGLSASVLFNLGVALQALEAKRAPVEEGLRLSLLERLLRRPVWVLGLALGGLGVVLEVVAFANAPFIVIEPLLAAGLLVLLAFGVRELGERPDAETLAGVFAIILGTVFIAWGAPEHSEEPPRAGDGGRGDGGDGRRLARPLRPARRPPRHRDAGERRLRLRLRGDQRRHQADGRRHRRRPPGQALAWLGVAAFAGITATISGMTALQRRPATTMVPISSAIQTFLPIALEPLFLTENWRSAELGGWLLLGGLLVMLVGTVMVARTRSVAAMST